MDKTINLGDRVKDRITGLEGIVIGITTWLYGCRRVTIQPEEIKDGRPSDPSSFDEPQLILVDTGVVESYATPSTPTPRHGPRADATRRADAER